MLYSYLLPKLRRMQYLAVKWTASARTMKARNSLFCMMLCSAATLHLAVDAKISASNRVALPVPSGKTTTVQGRQRPQFKAPPENGGMLTEASAGAPVAAHVTGNGELATTPPHLCEMKKPRAGIRTEPAAFAICSPRANHETTRDSSAERPTKAHYIRSV